MESDNLKTSTPLSYRHDSGFGSYGKHTNSSKNKLVELSPIRKQPLQSNLAAILRVCGILSPAKKLPINSLDRVTKKLTFTSSSDISDYASDNNVTENISFVTEQVQNENFLKKFTFSTDKNCNIIYDCINSEKLYQPFKYICKEDIYNEEPEPCESNNNISFFGSLSNHDSINVAQEDTDLKIDFMNELSNINCTAVLSQIFSYLSGEDITNASCVNKQWKDIVLSDRDARERRKIYIANKKNSSVGPNKENQVRGLSLPEKYHKSAFTCAKNVSFETPQLQKYVNIYEKFDSFLKEAKTIKKTQRLMKCPKCQYPSKPQCALKFRCTRKLCQYEFCSKCLGPFFKEHMCSVVEFNTTLPNIVGSKESKKSLKRL